MPTLAQRGDRPLPPGALAYLNVRAALDLLAAVVVAVVALRWYAPTWQSNGYLAIGVLAGISFLVEAPLLNRLRVRHTSYMVDPDFMYVTRGAFIKSSVLIPTGQIQSIETVQGPLLDRFGFATLRCKCITQVESLGPLDKVSVDRIREAVVKPERQRDDGSSD